MRTMRFFWWASLLGSFISSCGVAPQQASTQLPESMKGYELYSWQEGDQWNFSLLIGTNREKTVDEIKSADSVLRGVDALISTLEKVPTGQYVTWSSKGTLSFPSENIIKQVVRICKDQGLVLNIVK